MKDLSPFQSRIVPLLYSRMATKEMATTLGCTVLKVSNSLPIIYRKLKVNNRLDLLVTKLEQLEGEIRKNLGINLT